jgi:hypothetical protein
MNTTDLKHCENSEWNFALNISKHWNSFLRPPGHTGDLARSVAGWGTLTDEVFFKNVEVCRWTQPFSLCRKLLINTRLEPGAKGARRGKNRLNGFALARSWFTA